MEKNWFETIRDEVLDRAEEAKASLLPFSDRRAQALFDAPFELSVLGDFGFKDKSDHYELVTNLGGPKCESGTPEDAVKVELTGNDHRMVEVSYKHSSGNGEEAYYSHSQKTCVSLPADADDNTLEAFYDENDNVVVSVKKKAYQSGTATRTIPVKRA